MAETVISVAEKISELSRQDVADEVMRCEMRLKKLKVLYRALLIAESPLLGASLGSVVSMSADYLRANGPSRANQIADGIGRNAQAVRMALSRNRGGIFKKCGDCRWGLERANNSRGGRINNRICRVKQETTRQPGRR